MQRRVLCVWLPNWPCQRMLQSDRTLVDQPFVLQARDARRGLIVAASSPLARQAEVHPGMSISEARSLLATLTILDHDPQEDLDTLCLLADAAQRFSPIVGLETLETKLGKGASKSNSSLSNANLSKLNPSKTGSGKPWSGRSLFEPQALVLDATHLGVLFGGEEAMAREVGTWLKEQGYLGSVAMADSMGAAWGLANYGHRQQCSESLLKQHRGEEVPAIDPIVVAGDATQAALVHLPVEALRLDWGTVHSLRRLGIRTIGELVALPRDGLAARLGSGLIQRIDQAWLSEEETLVSLHVEPEFLVEQSLEYPTDCRETIEEILRRLSLELCKRMVKRGRGAIRMVSRLDLVGQPSIAMQLGLFRAVAEAGHLTPLLLGQLDRQWENLPALQIHRVTLQATLTSELTWQQPDLFEVDQVVHRESMAHLINTLSCRLGRRAVVTPQLHGDPQPELACSWRPLTGRRADGKSQITKRKFGRPAASADPKVSDPLRRPLALLQPPMPIEVAWGDEDSQEVERLPSRLRLNHTWLHVVRTWGPERIETGWWRGPSQRRDYYRVETSEGQWLWIFRQRTDGKWFLHGSFE